MEPSPGGKDWGHTSPTTLTAPDAVAPEIRACRYNINQSRVTFYFAKLKYLKNLTSNDQLLSSWERAP